jgi:hypothetical protein
MSPAELERRAERVTESEPHHAARGPVCYVAQASTLLIPQVSGSAVRAAPEVPGRESMQALRLYP